MIDTKEVMEETGNNTSKKVAKNKFESENNTLSAKGLHLILIYLLSNEYFFISKLLKA